mmetsp:Transcript_57329/g.105426  ORF Transcript_57329/g.105426 Transcript_57329/m.105426 type:complete len:698 (+) Transcript_57329:81-2174(+)
MSRASWTETRGSRSRHEGKPRFYAYNQDDTSSSNWGRQQWYHDDDPSFTRGGQQRPRRRHNEDKVSSSTTWGAQAWARYHRSEEKNSPYTWSEDDAETRSGNSRGSRALSPEASASWPSDDDERHGSDGVAKKSQMDGRACGQALLNMVKKSDKRRFQAGRESTAPGRAIQEAARREAPKAKQQAESAPAAAPSSSAASAPSASAALKQLVRSSPPAAVTAAPADTAAPSASAALARLIGTNAPSSAQSWPEDQSASATSGAAEESARSAVPDGPAAPSATSPPTTSVATAATASTMPSAMENPPLGSAPAASATSAQMMPQASTMLSQAPAATAEPWTLLGSRSQGSTKLRSSASMFVPGQSSPSAGPSHKSAQRTNGGQAKGPGREMLANLISQTFGTEIWNVMMVDCEDYTGRSYTAVELTLPMCSEWPASQLQQDQAALQNLRWNLNSMEGVQSAELSADGTALQMDYCLAGKDRLCWDFAHHGFCPRPACRWQHVAMEKFVITVLLRPSPVQKAMVVPQGANLGQAGGTMCVILQPNGQQTGQMAMQPVFQVVPQQVGKAIVMVQQPLVQQTTIQQLPHGEMMFVAEQQPIVQQMAMAPMQPGQTMATSGGLPMQRVNGAQHQELTVEDQEETHWQECAAPKHEGPAFFDNEADAEDVNGTLDSAKRVSWADLEDEDGEEIDLKQWAGPQLQ